VAQPCPLCLADALAPHAEVQGRHYVRCEACALVHLTPEDRLPPEAERAHYGTHENDPADPGYRAFLVRLANPLAQRLPPGAEGLDYGSGPGPTLSALLAERGFPTAIYDPFFAPDEAALRRTYDFVTCTETAEHFFAPRAEFERLDGLLRPGGWLGVMTEWRDEARPFAQWRYARDPTHACFYAPETMAWIARHFGWALETPARNVALFRKPPAR
jgi:hypothetical protein